MEKIKYGYLIYKRRSVPHNMYYFITDTKKIIIYRDTKMFLTGLDYYIENNNLCTCNYVISTLNTEKYDIYNNYEDYVILNKITSIFLLKIKCNYIEFLYKIRQIQRMFRKYVFMKYLKLSKILLLPAINEFIRFIK